MSSIARPSLVCRVLAVLAGHEFFSKWKLAAGQCRAYRFGGSLPPEIVREGEVG